MSRVGFTHTAIVCMCLANGFPVFDTLAAPDFTLWDCFTALASMLGYYLYFMRVVGWTSYGSWRLGAVLCGRWVVLSYFVAMLFMSVGFSLGSFVLNPLQTVGHSFLADFVDPDDGLEPAQRKQVKVQLVICVVTLLFAVGPRL